MAGGPIETAFIEIKPKVSGNFESQVRSSITPALDRVSSHVDKTALNVSRSFDTAGEKAGRSFDSAADAITADAKRAGNAIDREISHGASQAGSKIASIAKTAAVAFGGAFVARKGFDFLKGSIDAARESNAIAAQTAAAIKSTGGAANVAAGDVDKLANAIARKTGIDDEEIAKAENLLLTFTNVRNEAGKGNDIFNQATSILADMGKALGTDASGAAIQLGKALNDPVAGISALTRVGVTFNDKQKETIKNLVATGKTAEAQKIILAELGKEFGGSAEAQATAAAKLKVTLGNLQEDIGNKLIPVIDKVAGFLADRLPGAMDAAGRAVGKLKPVFEEVQLAFKLIVGGFQEGDVTSSGFHGKMEKLGATLRKVFEALKDLYENQIKPFANFLVNNVVPAVGKVASKLLDLGLFLGNHIEVIKKVAAVIAAVLIPHYIKLGAQAVISSVKQVTAWVASKAAAIQATVVSSVQFAIQIAKWVALGVAAMANAAIIAAAWLISLGPIALVVAAVVGLAVIIYKNWDTIKNAIVTAATFVLDFLRNNWPLILAILTGPIGLAVLAITKNWDTIKEGASAVWNWVKEKFNSLVEFVTGLPGRISSAASGMWDGIKNAFRSAINWVINKWNSLEFTLPSISAFGKTIGGFTLGTPDIKPFALGGIVDRPTLGLFGEAGREVNIPLTRPARAAQLAAESGLLRMIAPYFRGNSMAIAGSAKLAAVMPPLPSRVAAAGGTTFSPGAVQVTFAGALPTEAQAYMTGRATARGIADEMARTELRRAVRAR